MNLGWHPQDNRATSTQTNSQLPQTGKHLPMTGRHLPQTGTQEQSNASAAGLGFLGLAGLFGFLRRKRGNESKK